LKLVFLAPAALLFAQQSAVELANQAETLLRAHETQKAVALLDQAVQAPGATPESEDHIGFLLAVVGRGPEALQHFQQAISLSPDFAPAHYHLGAALWLAKDYSHGLPELQAAAKLAPANFDYRYHLGTAFLQVDDLEHAAAALKEAAAIDGSRPEVWTQLGTVLRKQNDPAAVDAYAHAVLVAPEDDAIRNTYASLLVQTRQPDKAIAESQKVLARKGSSDTARADAQMTVGYAYLKTGEFDQSEQAYRAAVALQPKSAASHYNLAIALKMKDQIEASEEEFQRAIDLDPALPEAHYSLGTAHWQLGDFPAAIKEMRAAISLRPNYAEAHYMLGITLKQSGDVDAAIPELKEAIRLDPTTPGPFNTLGQILRIKGDKTGSEEMFSKGARLKKEKDAELTNNLEQGMRGGIFPKPLDNPKP